VGNEGERGGGVASEGEKQYRREVSGAFNKGEGRESKKGVKAWGETEMRGE